MEQTEAGSTLGAGHRPDIGWLGTVLSREPEAEAMFDELYVRSETGLGAEEGTGLTLTGRSPGSRDGGADGRNPAAMAPSGTT